MRIVLWAALLIIIYRGVMAIALNETPASSSTGATGTTGATQFPATAAEAYVLQFGEVYFNFSQQNAPQRQQELASYFPQNMLSQQQNFGFNGAATTTLTTESVSGITVRTANSAVVNLLATINGRLMQFAVPVYAQYGGFAISGPPALLPAPGVLVLQAGQQPQPDQAAVAALTPVLTQFFTAYAASNMPELARYLAPGVTIGGLNGSVTFGSFAANSPYVPPGGSTRDATVTVNWQLPGQQGGLQATYDVTVVDLGGKWYVQAIRATTLPFGAAP